MKNIAVLLSTYNGGNYLSELLESIYNQQKITVQIYVRDDGSTDNTCEILELFKRDQGLVYYSGPNIGYKLSFIELSRRYKNLADYYAFADQDDVWLPDKLYNAVKFLDTDRSNNIKLYFSNMTVVDENLKYLGIKDFSNSFHTLGATISRHNVAGCTMVFTNQLLLLTEKFDLNLFSISHDSLFYKICLAVGGVCLYDNSSYILYRQHSSNLTGTRQGFQKRITTELKKFYSNRDLRFKIAKVLLNSYKDYLTEDADQLLTVIVKYKYSYMNTINLANCDKLKFGSFPVDFLTKLSILFRRF